MKTRTGRHWLPLLLAAACVIVAFNTVFAQITITPSSVDVSLTPGGEYMETKTVTIPGGETVTKVDIYLLADTTGSMGGAIANVRANADAVLDAITATIPDVRFGVGEYKDFPYDSYCFRNNQAITNDLALVHAGINMWSAGGGSDGSEGQFFALDRIAEPSDPFGINFRSGAQKIVVWFGDWPGHDPVCAAISGLPVDITEASLRAKLVANGFTIIAIGTTSGGIAGALNGDPTVSAGDYIGYCGTPGGMSGQADRIAGDTDGTSLQDVPSGDIVTAIINAITAVTSTVTVRLQPTGETAPFTTILTPPYVNVPLPPAGEFLTLTFDVKFTGLPCDPTRLAHIFMGGIDAIVDEAIGATQSVTIREPSCDAVQASMDIKPGSCPNSFNRREMGVLPVSVLGKSDFDVLSIDIATVRLMRDDGVGGSISPLSKPRPSYEDTATPFPGPLCGCHSLYGDGFFDLSLKFDAPRLVSALMLKDLPNGSMISLKMTGRLLDGRSFEAHDCIRLVPPQTIPAPGARIKRPQANVEIDLGNQ